MHCVLNNVIELCILISKLVVGRIGVSFFWVLSLVDARN